MSSRAQTDYCDIPESEKLHVGDRVYYQRKLTLFGTVESIREESTWRVWVHVVFDNDVGEADFMPHEIRKADVVEMVANLDRVEPVAEVAGVEVAGMHELVISRADVGSQVVRTGERDELMALAKEDAEAEAKGCGCPRQIVQLDDGFAVGQYRWTVRPESE